MKEEQHIHELIDQYLRGELIGEELDLFRIRLREDKKFLRQVQVQKAMIEEIGKVRETQLRSIFKKEKKKKRAFIIPFNRRVLSVAAVLLGITALAMVLKIYLPTNDLASEDQDITEKVEEDLTLAADEEPIQESLTIDTFMEDNSNLEVVEEVIEEDPLDELAEKEVAPKEDIALNEVKNLSRLREDEDKLKADDIDAKKDVLLSSTKIAIVSFEMKVPAVKSTDVKQVTVESESETTSKRSKKKDKKEEADFVEDTAVEDVPVAVPIATSGRNITIEYWKSIVNFKGYHFDGNVLMLYSVPDKTPVQVSTYNNKSYAKWGGNVYLILANGKYQPFSLVTDTEVLKVIGK